MFGESGLYRDKWEREDYRTETIAKSFQSKDFYNASFESVTPDMIAAANAAVGATPTTSTGSSTNAGVAGVFFELNGHGNEQRFLAQHGHKVRRSEQGDWWVYDGKRWKHDRKGYDVKEMAKSTLRSVADEAEAYYQATNNKRGAATYRKFAEGLRNNAATKNLVDGIESLPQLRISYEQFNQQPDLLNCQNGTVHLPTGELRPHNPNDYLTSIAPYSYVTGLLHPNWDKLLKRVFPRKDVRRAFMLYSASLLSGHNEDKLYLTMSGPSQTGKTTINNTLLKVFGTDYAELIPQELIAQWKWGAESNKKAAAQLIGKRFGLISETNKNMRIDQAALKSLTGGTRITVKLLWKDEFSYEPTTKLIVETNYKPKFNGGDTGMISRLLVIPCTEVIPEDEREPGYARKYLEPEHEAILSQLIDLYREYLVEGIQQSDYLKQARAAYVYDNDILKRFLYEMCEFGDQYKQKPQDLHEAYNIWVIAAEGLSYRMGRNNFKGELENRGYDQQHFRDGDFWVGFRLKRDNEYGSAGDYSTNQMVVNNGAAVKVFPELVDDDLIISA